MEKMMKLNVDSEMAFTFFVDIISVHINKCQPKYLSCDLCGKDGSFNGRKFRNESNLSKRIIVETNMHYTNEKGFKDNIYKLHIYTRTGRKNNGKKLWGKYSINLAKYTNYYHSYTEEISIKNGSRTCYMKLCINVQKMEYVQTKNWLTYQKERILYEKQQEIETVHERKESEINSSDTNQNNENNLNNVILSEEKNKKDEILQSLIQNTNDKKTASICEQEANTKHNVVVDQANYPSNEFLSSKLNMLNKPNISDEITEKTDQSSKVLKNSPSSLSSDDSNTFNDQQITNVGDEQNNNIHLMEEQNENHSVQFGNENCLSYSQVQKTDKQNMNPEKNSHSDRITKKSITEKTEQSNMNDSSIQQKDPSEKSNNTEEYKDVYEDDLNLQYKMNIKEKEEITESDDHNMQENVFKKFKIEKPLDTQPENSSEKSKNILSKKRSNPWNYADGTDTITQDYKSCHSQMNTESEELSEVKNQHKRFKSSDKIERSNINEKEETGDHQKKKEKTRKFRKNDDEVVGIIARYIRNCFRSIDLYNRSFEIIQSYQKCSMERKNISESKFQKIKSAFENLYKKYIEYMQHQISLSVLKKYYIRDKKEISPFIEKMIKMATYGEKYILEFKINNHKKMCI